MLLDVEASFIGRTTTLQEGWKVLNGAERLTARAREEDAQTIPPLQKGQTVHIAGMEVVEGDQTSKSLHDATPFTAMRMPDDRSKTTNWLQHRESGLRRRPRAPTP